MQIIAGLGNPGAKYAGNRHNIGFMALDAIHRKNRFSPWSKKFKAVISEGELAGEKVLLIKPQFEVGRTGVKGGIVHDRKLVAPALERVLVEAANCGLELVSLRPSPIVGTHGNSEFVAVFRTSTGSSPADADRLDTLRRAIVEAEELEADR